MSGAPLDNFDPFAVHPFTNCGTLHLPQRNAYRQKVVDQSVPISSPLKNSPSPPMGHAATISPMRPVFVPFKLGSASPDLVLKKRRADVK